jgi:hypothetical protein
MRIYFTSEEQGVMFSARGAHNGLTLEGLNLSWNVSALFIAQTELPLEVTSKNHAAVVLSYNNIVTYKEMIHVIPMKGAPKGLNYEHPPALSPLATNLTRTPFSGPKI